MIGQTATTYEALAVIAAILIISGASIAVYCALAAESARKAADARALHLAEIVNDMVEARIEATAARTIMERRLLEIGK